MIPRQTILDGLIAVLGVASLLLLHNPPVPSDESKLWYEVPLCDIGSGELRSHVPLETGCADLAFNPERRTPVRFTVPSNHLLPEARYQVMLVANDTLLVGSAVAPPKIEGRVSVFGEIVDELALPKMPIPASSASSTSYSSNKNANSPLQQRRRKLLKGGGWGSSSPATSARLPGRSSGASSYRRSFRRRYGMGRRMWRHRPSWHSSPREGPFETEEFIDVFSHHRLAGDVGEFGCESSTESGCQRVVSGMARMPISGNSIILGKNHPQLDTLGVLIELDHLSLFKAPTFAASSSYQAYVLLWCQDSMNNSSLRFIIDWLPSMLSAILLSVATATVFSSRPHPSAVARNTTGAAWLCVAGVFAGILFFPAFFDPDIQFYSVLGMLLIYGISRVVSSILQPTVNTLGLASRRPPPRRALEPWASEPLRLKRALAGASTYFRCEDDVTTVRDVALRTATHFRVNRTHCSEIMVEADDNDIATWSAAASRQMEEALSAQLHLNLHSNDLRSIAAGVSELRTLRTLDASDCNIGPSLNGVASGSLEWLSVANNNLQSIGQSAGPFPKLTYLDLRSNDLTTLAGLTSATTGGDNQLFPGLRALDLSDNSLKDLRGLEGLKGLESLSIDNNDLGDNAIAQLCSLIDGMPQLRFLTCEENEWSTRAEQVLEEHINTVNRGRTIEIDLYT